MIKATDENVMWKLYLELVKMVRFKLMHNSLYISLFDKYTIISISN